MFEKYTEGARRTIFYARFEAASRDAPSIAPEHLLLGMLRAEPEMIRRLSPGPGDNPADLHREISAVLPPEGETKSVEMSLSAEAKSVLYAADESSRAMRHLHIGVEHILLGLLGPKRREGGGAESGLDVGRFLSELGMDRQAIEEMVRGGTTSA